MQKKSQNIDKFELILKKNKQGLHKLLLKNKQKNIIMLQENWSIGHLLTEPSAESPLLHVDDFRHDPEVDHTLANWPENCEDVFRNDLADDPDNE